MPRNQGSRNDPSSKLDDWRPALFGTSTGVPGCEKLSGLGFWIFDRLTPEPQPAKDAMDASVFFQIIYAAGLILYLERSLPLESDEPWTAEERRAARALLQAKTRAQARNWERRDAQSASRRLLWIVLRKVEVVEALGTKRLEKRVAPGRASSIGHLVQ